MKASIHYLDNKLYAVPELEFDMFFGILKPNDLYIQDNGVLLDNQDMKIKEGTIVVGYSFAGRFIIESFEE